jgi:integrase
MAPRAKGTGSIYKLKNSRFWWIAYRGADGRRHHESSESERKGDAQRLLTSRLGDVGRGVPVTPRVVKLTFADAAQDVTNDYVANGKRSLPVVQRRINKHLTPYFGAERRMASITTADVRAYVAERLATPSVLVKKARTETLEDGTVVEHPEQRRPASAGEVNRELTILKRMFSLAVQAGKLLHKPHVPMLREDNVRTGFFEAEQLAAVERHLPAPIQPVVRFMAITGWRGGEVVSLEWRQVDLDGGEVRLDPGTTKNREGRVFPLTSELRTLLEAQGAVRDALRRDGRMVPLVFHRDGKRIESFLRAWHTACRKAGCPGRIPHDLRRTAVRNLVRAGIPERVAMKLTGHKTRSVFERYNIVSDGDFKEAARKLDATTPSEAQSSASR